MLVAIDAESRAGVNKMIRNAIEAGAAALFEDLLEAITLKRLCRFFKPNAIFNQDGY